MDRNTDTPAAMVKGKIAYLAHPVFTTYAQHSMPFHRDLVLACLDRILPDPLMRASGPTSLQATLTALPDGRRVVHLLHYVPERRGLRLDIVEDRMPLHNVQIDVRGEFNPTLQPQGQPLDCKRVSGRTAFAVPLVDGHQMIELSVDFEALTGAEALGTVP